MTPAISKKICLLGDFAVGKTSLVRRFIFNLFDDKYLSTIGVKVSRKTMMVPHDGDVVELTLMIWDLAGSDEFDQVRASYMRGAAGAVLVCDVTRPQTLAALERYAHDLQSMNPAARFVLAANKHDLTMGEGRQDAWLSPAQVELVAAGLDAPWAFTSAKTGEEVEALFRHLASALVAVPGRHGDVETG